MSYNTIVQMYKKGLGSTEISRRLGISSTAVLKALDRRNVDRRSLNQYRKYQIHPETLMDLTGEIGAYWFGFLLMKGSIRRGRLRCDVNGDDVGHLYQLARDLGMVKLPKKRIITLNDKKYGTAYLTIDCTELTKFYEEMGWNDFKSLGAMPKLEDRHFIRGLLDGSSDERETLNRFRLDLDDETLRQLYTNQVRCLKRNLTRHLNTICRQVSSRTAVCL